MEVSRARVFGSPRLFWMDTANFYLGSRGMMVKVRDNRERQTLEESPGAYVDD